MKKIILCTNPIRDVGLAFANTISKRLVDSGADTEIFPLHYFTEEQTEVDRTGLDGLRERIAGAQLLICFGGDGTILHLARAAADLELPILTVNLGNKGFMAELEPKDGDKIIEIAMADEYKIEERMMIDITVHRSSEKVYSGFALNDAVIAGATRVVDIEVYGDGQMITQFAGDGLIVSTPTGSTAYSMAAGGPIIEPTANNLLITPICAHALIAKSFVLAPNRIVSVKLSLYGGKKAYLSVDGGSFSLEDMDAVVITRSKYVTRLVKASEKSFYQIVNEKLGE